MTDAHTKVSKPSRMAIKLEELFLRDSGEEATGEPSGGTPSPAHRCLCNQMKPTNQEPVSAPREWPFA